MEISRQQRARSGREGTEVEEGTVRRGRDNNTNSNVVDRKGRGRRSRKNPSQSMNRNEDFTGQEDGEHLLDLEAIKRTALAGLHCFAGGSEEEPRKRFIGFGTTQAAPATSFSNKSSGESFGGEIYTNKEKAARAARFGSDLHAPDVQRAATAAVEKLAGEVCEDSTDSAFIEDGPITEHIIGTCELMCPMGERDLRERKNDIELFERLDPTDRSTSHPALCIKKYTRIVDNVTPDMVRTRDALANSVSHLYSLLDSRPEVPFMTKSKFLWDRLRSVRQDLSLQAITDGFAMPLLEQMVRFAILSEHELCEETATVTNPDGHNSHLNVEQLAKTLTSLRHLYDDHAQRCLVPGGPGAEAEMFAYQLLLRIDSHGRYNVERREMLNDLRSARLNVLLSPDVQFALAAHRAYHANNVVAFFRLVQDATYLQACVLHKYFSRIRSRAFETMNATFGKQAMPMKQVAHLLQSDIDEAEALALHHGLTVMRSADLTGKVEMIKFGASEDACETFLMLRDSGYIDPADEFPILRSSLVDSKRAASYLDEIDPHHLSRKARLSRMGGSGLVATDFNSDDKAALTTQHAALGASVKFASEVPRDPPHSYATPCVPPNYRMTELTGPRLLAPMKEAVAAAAEEAASTMIAAGGFSSLGFPGEQRTLNTVNGQVATYGRLSLIASVKARQSATEAATERLRADIDAKELKMRQRRQHKASISEIDVQNLAPQAFKSLPQSIDLSDVNDVKSDSMRVLNSASGTNWEDVERPPFTMLLSESTGLSRMYNRANNKWENHTCPVSRLVELRVMQDALRVHNSPQKEQKHAVEVTKSEPHQVVWERHRVKEAEPCWIDDVADNTVVDWDKEREGLNHEASKAEIGQHDVTTKHSAVIAAQARAAAKLARQTNRDCVAHLRFIMARWWAHSRIQAYNQREGRITVSRTGAAPTPNIHHFNTSTAAHLLRNITPVPSLMFSEALIELREKMDTRQSMPWGNPLDIPKIICNALSIDGHESISPQLRSLGQLATWKLLVCSGAECVIARVKQSPMQDRTPLATMVADWLRAKLSRGGGKQKKVANTIAHDTDGTMLYLYSSRLCDGGCSNNARSTPHDVDFSMQTACSILSHPTSTAASPVLWVCVRDVPMAPSNPAPPKIPDRGTTRSDAAAIIFVIDLDAGDVGDSCDFLDSTHVVPAVEEERFLKFIASLPKPKEDAPPNSAAAIIVLAVTEKAADAHTTINYVETTFSAAFGGVQRHAICVKLLQSSLLRKHDRAGVAAASVEWDTLLEDGLRWAAALAPPQSHLLAVYLRDEVADALLPVANFAEAANSLGCVSSKGLNPDEYVAVFNDAVQRVRCRIISAAAASDATSAAAGSCFSINGRTSGSKVGASNLPCDFLAGGSSTSLEWAAERCRTDVLLSILDGAMLPHFTPEASVNTRNVLPVAATARLHLYLSELNPSEAFPPGAVTALLVKAGYTDGIINYSSREIGDHGGGWLTVFREIFACRLAGIETAQRASGVGPAYIVPRSKDPSTLLPTTSACHEATIQAYASAPTRDLVNAGSSPSSSALYSLRMLNWCPEYPLADTKQHAQEFDLVRSCMEICTSDKLSLKRKRSTVGMHDAQQTFVHTDIAGETAHSYSTACDGNSGGTRTMAKSLSSALKETDNLEQWLVGATAMDTAHGPILSMGSDDLFSMLELHTEQENVIAESLQRSGVISSKGTDVLGW
eukprot:CAMPEP_0197574634 /NCGR_PEP_ID=MMETSP1326-20131121/301_1 /TAXON_ID=1155430 /ORGANISM="Genus nov. species nov., Strain RCC2288" /LENGTH=1713 /DNA_ID=CAMNT_0043137257 /DNA_START=40 /DNA_END=5178 /DNA_ORIENTATION=+